MTYRDGLWVLIHIEGYGGSEPFIEASVFDTQEEAEAERLRSCDGLECVVRESV